MTPLKSTHIPGGVPGFSLKNVSVFYQEQQIIYDVSLSLKKGEVLALVGESGAGKTLLMKTLCGLLPVQGGIFTSRSSASGLHAQGTLQLAQGSIDLEDEEPGDSVHRPGGMAMIFQDPGSYLNPGMRVETFLEEVLKFRTGELSDSMTVPALLERVRLNPDKRLLKSFPFELSGGMQQRLVIAAVLASDPDLIVADEALSALDVATAAEILSLFRELVQDEGRTMVYISHDLKSVAEVADRVTVMYGGRILEDRPAKDLFSNPRHPYSRALIRSHPGYANRGRILPEIPGDSSASKDVSLGCPFAGRCDRVQDECRRGFPQVTGNPGDRFFCYNPLEQTEGSQ